ncbi:MAG: DUF5696 domain-containing protein [Acutalibacteraceae bacterium]|nr:DUF5696 domain-containing protein [Acutalibacteraceae bacterium]
MIVSDNNGKEYPVIKCGDTYTVKKSDINCGCKYIDFKNDLFKACTGEDGYYAVTDPGKTCRLVRFREREDGERVFHQYLMPMFGVKNSKGCFLIIAEGYKYEMNAVFGIKDGVYYIYPRFIIMEQDGIPYEDISIKIIKLDDDADYVDMAVKYREYKLGRKDCLPIKTRMKKSPELAYAAEAPEIRIRMGWKPVPATVMEQTVENEPEMKVACTFDRVCDFIDELKKRGVDKAQICLVGWNKSGHDGRWPQTFPVEEKLGGEVALKHLIKYAKEKGYQIVCHTNSTDCYSIADTFSEDIVIKKENGELSVNKDSWGGGRMYHLCPTKAVEYADRDLPKIRDLGFDGLHYIDVMSGVPLRWCFDKKHPVNSEQSLMCYNKIMNKCHELFGGFSSESACDFCAKYLDYGFYVSYLKVNDSMFDDAVPLWEITYHGIILYNTSTETVNYCIKCDQERLNLYESGGRPTFYIYSKFIEGSYLDNWLGKNDLMIGTEEELQFTADKIASSYEEFKKYRHLQTEFIVKHRKVAEGIYEIIYSNGEKLVVDYNSADIKLNQ